MERGEGRGEVQAGRNILNGKESKKCRKVMFMFQDTIAVIAGKKQERSLFRLGLKIQRESVGIFAPIVWLKAWIKYWESQRLKTGSKK